MFSKIFRAKVKPPIAAKILFPRIYWRINNNKKKIYLTFDDGPIPDITDWVLDTLNKYKIKASFFCVGDNVKKHPTVYQRIIREGHAVGCHTHNHLSAWQTKRNNYLQNVKESESYITSNLFRPPYGKIRHRLSRNLSQRYKIIMWDVLSKDYDSNISPQECLSNVINNTRSGSIIVFHDSKKSETNLKYALPLAIEFLQEKNYEFDIIRL